MRVICGGSLFAVRADRYGLRIGADDRPMTLAGRIGGEVLGFT